MAYTTNPHLPRLRMEAVRLVKYRGWSTRKVARYTGFSQSAIVKWCAKDETGGWERIDTRSCRPKFHPAQLDDELVAAIVAKRLALNRSSEVIQEALARDGITVSLSSVKRTLARHELLKPRSKWKRRRTAIPRPPADTPGALVQMDTIHFIDWYSQRRFYVYVALDVFSRLAHAEVHDRLRQTTSLQVALRARRRAGFGFAMIQTDNGPEFGKWFEDMLKAKSIALRHSRVRQANDNAYVERFNRTLQDECLGKYPLRNSVTPAKLNTYLDYYNNQRLHFGLKLKTPAEVIPSYWLENVSA